MTKGSHPVGALQELGCYSPSDPAQGVQPVQLIAAPSSAWVQPHAVGSTPVMLADGTTKPIDQVKPGDKVLATNTRTGKTSPETVTAVSVRHDTDL